MRWIDWSIQNEMRVAKSWRWLESVFWSNIDVHIVKIDRFNDDLITWTRRIMRRIAESLRLYIRHVYMYTYICIYFIVVFCSSILFLRVCECVFVKVLVCWARVKVNYYRLATAVWWWRRRRQLCWLLIIRVLVPNMVVAATCGRNGWKTNGMVPAAKCCAVEAAAKWKYMHCTYELKSLHIDIQQLCNRRARRISKAPYYLLSWNYEILLKISVLAKQIFLYNFVY